MSINSSNQQKIDRWARLKNWYYGHAHDQWQGRGENLVDDELLGSVANVNCPQVVELVGVEGWSRNWVGVERNSYGLSVAVLRMRQGSDESADGWADGRISGRKHGYKWSNEGNFF